MLEHVLPDQISSNQKPCVKYRCITESDRLISDVMEMYHIQDIPSYIVTMDIEKAVYSLDHDFFILKILVSLKISYTE